jgi:Rubrerythrin
MKRIIFAALAAVVLLTSCATKADKTIESLKAAATGESNASAHYKQFSEKAYAEGFINVGNMFAATSHAESLHAAKHLEELAKLGVKDFVPEVTPAEVKSTLENLKEAVAGETYEFTDMYPGFMEIATSENRETVHTYLLSGQTEPKLTCRVLH